jgi:two-component system response regulator
MTDMQRPTEAQPILIIEDSADDFEATKRAFGRTNLRNPIEHAWSGEEALAYLRSGTRVTPGIILLDLNMPGLDGRRTLALIKQATELKKIPVVIRLITAIQQLKEYWFEIAVLPKDPDHAH